MRPRSGGEGGRASSGRAPGTGLGVLRVLLLLVAAGCATQHAGGPSSSDGARPPRPLPGTVDGGRVRLPNGWFLSPAGDAVHVDELPLNMELSPDGKYLVVTEAGTAWQGISILETGDWKEIQRIALPSAWLGLRFRADGSSFFVSGGNQNRIYEFAMDGGRARLADSIVLGEPWPKAKIWVAGIDISEADGRLFACGRQNDSLYAVDLATRHVSASVRLGAKPYTCLYSPGNRLLYVSLWGGGAVAMFDPTTLAPLHIVKTAPHPSAMVEDEEGHTLYVSGANLNAVSVIDVPTGNVVETLTTSLRPDAPPGSTPNALALNPEGTRLYVANADNNDLAVFDVSHPRQSRALGFVPTGWYPTAVRMSPDGATIYVAEGKGRRSAANPKGPVPGKATPGKGVQYIGSLLHGSIARFAAPDDDALARYTRAVRANTPEVTAEPADAGGAGASAQGDGAPLANPIPLRPGDPSPIKHVFYIIKENRTYDQVLGDVQRGNGDASLCLFPREVTPNHHGIADTFVLLDNFYVNAEVSADGHNWSMAAYATDYVEKSWPTVYGDRGGDYEYEGGYDIAYPANGYLWDNCNRHGVSYRVYGEFCESGKTPADPSIPLMKSLAGHVAPRYRAWDLAYPDSARARAWMDEFEGFERNGDLPALCILKLPGDHTSGAEKGRPTPRAYVAENDLALGMIVERISHSRYWRESAIFVIEDDAQNGPDHVDAHRSVALVASPWARRHAVASGLYTTAGLVRTIELILGLPPLSQFDAAATPMRDCFMETPDTMAYTFARPSVDLGEKNLASAFGAEASMAMDFSGEDRADDATLSEIVWKSVRGAGSVMPAPVRSAFLSAARSPGR